MSNQPSPEQIVKAKLYTATALIREGNKDAARAVLLTTPNDPNAQRLLMQLGDAPEVRLKSGVSPMVWGLAIAVAIVLTGVVSILGTYQYIQRTDPVIQLRNTFAAILPTQGALTATVESATLTALLSRSTSTPVVSENSSAAIPPTKTPAPSTGKWQKNQSTSAMDDTENIYIFLEAESEVSDGISSDKPVVIVRCKAGELEAIITPQTFIQETSLDSKEAQFRLRFDKNQPTRETWGLSTDRKAVFADHPEAFVSDMMNAHSMVFEFTPNISEAAVSTTFDLTGLSEAIKPIYAACNIAH